MKKLITSLVCLGLAAQLQAAKLDSETQCLAQNVYHEARGESWHGKMAVALVTLNRTEHWRFPKTICKVVYQPGQFTWTQYRNLRIYETHAWQDSVLVALIAREFHKEYAQHFPALYFHNKQVKPLWRHRRVATIGNHIFYH